MERNRPDALNRARLQQTSLHYASNARQFTDQCPVRRRSLKPNETSDSVLVDFEVKDAGIGIAPETQAHRQPNRR